MRCRKIRVFYIGEYPAMDHKSMSRSIDTEPDTIPMNSDSIHTPVLIVGGGTGGVAAALALATRGISCVMTEPTDWVGGQLTSQAVPPDENRWIEGREGIQSATQTYLDYRNQVRDWYRLRRNLSPAAHSNRYLNPGNGWVSRLCHEPRIGSRRASARMLAPFLASKKLQLLCRDPASLSTNPRRPHQLRRRPPI